MTAATVMMKIFVFIFTGFFSMGSCSGLQKQNNMLRDPFHSVASIKTEEYLETTELPASVKLESSVRASFAKDFLKAEPVVSEPLFQDILWDKSDSKKSSSKRDTLTEAWTHANKMQMLQLHNIYRSNVTPPAGNMAYMEWDVELEKLAMLWANRCVFEHGMPDHDYPETIGQNLYIGTDPTGYLGLYLWYEEYHYYEMRNEHCLPNKQCGHYVQMAWSESTKLGCAMNKCNMRYYVVCHYSPQALKGVQMYRVAKPCSQCSGKDQILCLKNLCMTRNQCKNNPFDCQYADCNLECHNCGRLDKKTCKCECTDGWDSPDCSRLCMDKHKRCGMSPGWPNKASCSLNGYAVGKTYCRKMCDMCNPMLENSNDTCCNKKLCDDGFVLDTSKKSCKCVLLCPGPLCDGKEMAETQAALGSGTDFIRIFPYVTFWVILLGLREKFLWKCI